MQHIDDPFLREGTPSLRSSPPSCFTLVWLLAALGFLLLGAPSVRADRSPAGCLGSGLGISLYTSLPDVHVGDTIHYSINVFNTPFPACDAGWTNPAIAGAIHAYVVTPDGLTNTVTLRRTYLAPGESDFYTNVVSYVVRAQDILPDGTVRATASDDGDIHQNDTNSRGGGFQGVNVEVNLPCVQITAQCVGSVGENGAITFTGTVNNCGNNTLVGVTVTNAHDAGIFTVLFPTNLAKGQTAPFSGSWVPLNPCSPSTATLTVVAVDQFTSTPKTVTASTTVTCQNTLNQGIKVTVACPPAPVAPGQLLTYSGSVSNTGNITLQNIVVVNNQPALNTSVFTLASLAPGAVANFTGSYVAPTNCSVANTLTASASSVCGVAVSDTASATCPITTTPRIAVTAVCPSTPMVPGASLTYSGTVRNTGDITLTGVVVVSDRPAANTTVFSTDSLAPGASANFTGSYTVPADACSITTTFKGTGKDFCTTAAVTDSVTTTCSITTAPAIAVTLACPAASATTGGSITYSGTVRNSGDVTLNNVTVVNNQTSPSTVLTLPTLAPGVSANFAATFTAPADACSVTSTVTATGTDSCAGKSVSNSASATCTLLTTPSIAITQSCPTSSTIPGGLLTYSGTVRNSGNSTLTNVVVLNNQSGAAPVLTVASLAPGATANFTGSYLAPTNCSVTSSSTATARSICGVAVTDTVSSTCPVSTAPQIAVTASCPTTPLVPGGSASYSGTVKNTGNITLTSVVVVSDRPAANTTVFSTDSLAPGASASFTGSYTVPATACGVATLFTATGKDLCATTTVTNTFTTTCGVATAPAIAVTLACPAVSATTGGPITYTGTVRNSGDVALINVTVTDSQAVPSTVFTVASLAPGVSANFTATFTAPADACSVSSTVTATGTDNCAGTSVSNSASATCTLITTPSIAITQSCPTSSTVPGGLLTYSGTVRNSGNSTLTNVVVLNNQSGAAPVLSVASLAPGATANFTGSYLAPTNCSVTSSSTATARSICGVAVTDTVSSTCPVSTAPQIAVTASCPTTPLVPGGSASYSGTVRNTGNITLTGVVVVSDRPAANTTVFTTDSLAPGASASFTGSYTIPADVCSLTTLFTATGKDLCALSSVTNTVSTTCTITTAPAIAVTLDCPAVQVPTSGSITYTGTVRNSGNVTLNNVTVSDSQAAPSTVLTVPSLAPGASANFAASFTAPANTCSVSSTATATGSDACSGALVTNSASATCPLTTAPGISITQACPVTPAIPGGQLTYTATVRNTGNITLNNVTVNSAGSAITVSTNATSTIWMDDDTPHEALLTGFGGDSWNWVTSNPTPFSGTRAHQSSNNSGTHQHVFKYVSSALPIFAGDTLFAYVYLDTVNVPTEVMLEWNDGSFEHRAYWGDNSISLGTDGTASRRYMGPLPATGRWVRLEVPASLVGLEGSRVSGMGFTLFGGMATWDAAGKVGQSVGTVISSGTSVYTAATLAPGASADFTVSYALPTDVGCSYTSALTAVGADTCTGAQVTANTSTTCSLVGLPAIQVSQVCPTTPVLQGGILTYSGTVKNSGNTTLTNIIVTDNRPAPNTVIFTAASLAPGASSSFTGSYQVPLNCCVVWSTVQASGQSCDGVTVTDSDSGTCSVLTSPSIVVTKVCPTKEVRPGELLHYSGTVSNPGNITLVNVTLVNDVSGAGAPFFGPIALAPGESVNYDASYVVPSDFCGTDTVTATGLDACTFASTAKSVTTSCPVISTPRIAVTKYCPSLTTPRGGLFTFTGTVSNTGDVTLTNVVVVNNYQADCYTRTNGPVIGPITLAPGASFNFSGSYTAPESCCEIIDTLTASGQDRCGGTRVTASATAVCPLISTPRIAVTRVCPQATVPTGGLFTYTGVVSNPGDVVLTNVYVLSSQPSANTPVLGPIELAPGETKAFSGSYTVTAGSNPTTDTVRASGTDICEGRTVTAAADCLGAVAPLGITSLTLANGTTTVSWTATPGAVYRLQYRLNLQGSAWVDLPGDVTATGTTASKNHAVGAASQGVYRVMMLQE